MSPQETEITLYTSGTPNGQKASITLEELGLKYKTVEIQISQNQQKEDWYLRINPNGRIPAIVDKTTKREKRIFESGAIMLYLCQKYDTGFKISYPFDSDEYWEVVEWLIWMQSGIGPMQGQANHFFRYAPEKIEYGIKRYQTETKRLYQVLEDRLAQQASSKTTVSDSSTSIFGDSKLGNQSGPDTQGPWIVGNKCTIADLACFAWINWAEWAGVNLAEFKRVKDWTDRINERPAVKRGLDVPEKFKMKEKMKTKEGEEEYSKYHSDWVMKGQEADQEKRVGGKVGGTGQLSSDELTAANRQSGLVTKQWPTMERNTTFGRKVPSTANKTFDELVNETPVKSLEYPVSLTDGRLQSLYSDNSINWKPYAAKLHAL